MEVKDCNDRIDGCLEENRLGSRNLYETHPFNQAIKLKIASILQRLPHSETLENWLV